LELLGNITFSKRQCYAKTVDTISLFYHHDPWRGGGKSGVFCRFWQYVLRNTQFEYVKGEAGIRVRYLEDV